jgi:hypothetical protein
MGRITGKNDTGAATAKQRKRPIQKAAVSLGFAAAVIYLVVLGNMLLFPRGDNVFAIKAYAMEPQEDGSVALRGVDLLGEETYYWSTFTDGKSFFVSANLKCEGENIRSVDFYTADGFFAKQHLKTENGKIVSGVPAIYRKAPGDTNYTLAMYGTDFEVIGSRFTLEKDAMTEDFLLFLGTEISNGQERPSRMTLRAVATFDDGNKQEESITLDLESAELVGIVETPPEENEKEQAEAIQMDALIISVPLDQCEVVPGSEKILTYGDSFEYEIIGTTGTGITPITEESMDPASAEGMKQAGLIGPFDETGNLRFGASQNLFSGNEYDGKDGYIAVIENNGDGTFTGKTYRVPRELIGELMG